MQHRALTYLLVGVWFLSASLAAQVTVVAVTLDEAFVESRLFPSPLLRRTVAPITVTTGFRLSADQGTTRTNLSFALTEAPGRSWAATLSAEAAYTMFASPTGANGRTHADVLVALRSPIPESGILAINGFSLPSSGYGLGQAIAAVDLHNDGVREFFLDPTAPYDQLQWIELPLTVDGSGTVVRLTHWGNISTAPAGFDDYSMQLEVRFVAGVSPANRYGPAQSYPLTIDRQPDGTVNASFRSTFIPGQILLIGLQEQNMVIPFPPGDSLLTTVDFIVPMVNPVVRLPGALVPLGSGLHLQGIEFAANGEVRTSGAVRVGL